MTGASDKSERAAAATQSSPQAVLSKADIPSAEDILEAAYKEGYFAGTKDPHVENVTAMFLHSETARACRSRTDMAEIQRLRMFLVTIMVNIEKSPRCTKDDIKSLCSLGLNGKSLHEAALALGATPLRAQGTSGSAQDAQRLDPQGESPVTAGHAPETPLSTPLPSGSIER